MENTGKLYNVKKLAIKWFKLLKSLLQIQPANPFGQVDITLCTSYLILNSRNFSFFLCYTIMFPKVYPSTRGICAP